jgi:hypothetical protein
MGRHSAPDDEDEVAAISAAEIAADEAAAAAAGRHARSDDSPSDADPADHSADEQHTDVIVIDPALLPPEEAAEADGLPGLLADLPGALEPPAEEPSPSWAHRLAAKRAEKAARKQQATVAAPTSRIQLAEPDTAPAEPVRTESDTQADLRLLRESNAVRAQCLAALVVSFALYTVVLLVISHLGSYLFWIWVPIVLAGVLVGAVLDTAHKRERRSAP